MGFLFFFFCSNKSKTVPGQVGRVVLQWPSDGTNSLVTSHLMLQPHYVLLHRPGWSAQAGGRPAPRAAKPGKKAPVPGVRARDVYGRTRKGMGSFSRGETGILHHQSPRTLPSGLDSCSSILILCWDAEVKKGDDCSEAKGKRYIPTAITAVKMAR